MVTQRTWMARISNTVKYKYWFKSSAIHHDSVVVGSTPAEAAIFYPCRIMEVCLALTQEVEDRNLSGVPEESR